MKIRALKTATWLIMLLFLVGCGSARELPPLEQSLSCAVKLTKNGVEYQGVLNRPWIGSYTFTVSSPKYMEGMEILLQNGAVSYEFEGLQYTLEYSADHSPWKSVAQALDQAMRNDGGLLWEMNQQQWVCKGTIDGGDFTVHFDRETSLPVYLETQDGLTVNFIT